MEGREVRRLICIGCPMGCALSVELQGGRVEKVTGFTCGRGKAYAEQEVTSPRRTVTSTVRIIGGRRPVLPVRTAGEVPKELVGACMDEIRAVTAEAPVHIGDVLLRDIAGTGIALVAAKEMEKSGAVRLRQRDAAEGVCKAERAERRDKL